MKSKNKFTTFLTFIRPWYIISIAVVIAAVMVSSAFLELSQSKEELQILMKQEAESLIETINWSSVNAVISNEEIEDLIGQRLLSSARMISRLDSLSILTPTVLEGIALENNLYRINIFNNDGEKVVSNPHPDTARETGLQKHSPGEFIKPILKGEKDEIIIGFKEARHEKGDRFAVAVKRKNNRDGVIVVNVDAEYILDFQRKTGFDKMINDIGNHEGIEYIVLQDFNGIISSNRDVSGMNNIDNDTFLKHTTESDSINTRYFEFQNKEIFETAKVFFVNGKKLGIFRVGISTKQMQALESRMLRRIIILSIILFLISFISISIIFISQNYKSLSTKYEKIRTYTGNILANMADAVISTDKTGTITIFNKNAELLFGLKQDTISGKKINEVLPEKFHELEKHIKFKKTINNEEISFYRNSKNIITSVSSAFTFDKGGNVDAFTIVIKDITEIKNAEEQSKQREKFAAMGELASGVAHEIRNPLNTISMIAQRYDNEFIPGENKDEYKNITGVLLSETKRVNNIIQQFLRYARPPKINLININSIDFVKDIKKVAEASTGSKQIKLIFVNNDNFDLRIDIDLMKQALINLLNNSMDAVKEGGEINFNMQKYENNAEIVISDNGYGIPGENLSKIFNLYFTTKPNGTGLGLSLVQQIVSQHNGLIKVESIPGTGTKFLITIPLN
ncbi:MAG: PAS domain S-box protein [Ignavibacteriae bacterium]|nr:MAG: PAS domain S-box protein [Ignavibacteriota bacterium]